MYMGQQMDEWMQDDENLERWECTKKPNAGVDVSLDLGFSLIDIRF